MRNTHPLAGDLLIADNVLAEVTAYQLVVALAQQILGEGLPCFHHGVHFLFELCEHGLAVEGALVGLHELIENVQLFLAVVGLAEELAEQHQLVDGGGDLCHEDGVVGFLGRVGLGGEVAVHGVACFVCQGGNVVQGVGIVQKDIGLGIVAAGAVSTATLALVGVNVCPALFLKACGQGGVVFLAEELDGIQDDVNRFLVGILTVAGGDEGGVDVVEVKLGNTQSLLLQRVVIVERLQVLGNGVAQVVVDNGGHLVTEDGGGDAVGEVSHLGVGGALLDEGVHQCGVGVAEGGIGSVDTVEGRLTDAAVGALEEDAVGAVGERHGLAVFPFDLAEGEIGVGEGGADVAVGVEACGQVCHQLFALVGQGVGTVAEGGLDGAAVFLQLGEFGEPFVQSLVVQAEKVGIHEEGGGGQVVVQVHHAALQGNVAVIGGVHVGVKGGVAVKLLEDTAQSGHIAEHIVQRLCTCEHGVLMGRECGDHFLGAVIVGIKGLHVCVDHGEIPFVLCRNIGSYVGHVFAPLYVLFFHFQYGNTGLALPVSSHTEGGDAVVLAEELPKGGP